MKLACLISLIAVALGEIGCSHTETPNLQGSAAQVSAPELMIRYGCPACHVIPGVPGAVGKVGPSLKDLGQRSFLAGTLQNSQQNLIRWVQHPQQLHPGTAMPEMSVTTTDAARIADFLRNNQ